MKSLLRNFSLNLLILFPPKFVFFLKVNSSLHQMKTDLKHVVYIDAENKNNLPENYNDNKTVPFQQFLSSTLAREQAPVDIMEDIAILPFSSGTTGPPKVRAFSRYVASLEVILSLTYWLNY